MDVIDFISKPLDPYIIKVQEQQARLDPSRKVIRFENNEELVQWAYNYFQDSSHAEKVSHFTLPHFSPEENENSGKEVRSSSLPPAPRTFKNNHW